MFFNGRRQQAFVIEIRGEVPTYLRADRAPTDDIQQARLFFSLDTAERCRAHHPCFRILPVTVTLHVSLEQ